MATFNVGFYSGGEISVPQNFKPNSALWTGYAHSKSKVPIDTIWNSQNTTQSVRMQHDNKQ